MDSIRTDVIGGFNQFVREQRAAGDNACVTLVQFDTLGIDTVYSAAPVSECEELSERTYVPRAGTPLLDAMGRTIVQTGERLAAMPEGDRPDKVVFVVITDGLENSSHEYDKARIKEMVEHQTEVYKWNFVYLGANQDAFSEAASMGISMAASATYTPDNADAMFASMSSNVASYRVTNSVDSLTYTPEQHKALTRAGKKARAKR
jgi:hypothetical protein